MQPLRPVRSLRSKPRDVGIQRARAIRHRLAGELRLARVSSGLTQQQIAGLAGVSQAFVSAVERGVRAPSLAIGSRIAAACGYELSIRLFPAAGVALHDSGQLALLRQITAHAAKSWHARLEQPVASGDRRAADLVLEGLREVLHAEAEGGIADFQAQVRSAQLKRDALSARYDRPVRLILALPDRRSLRAIVRTHSDLIGRVFPASSPAIWHAIRNGGEVGGDGILFVPTPRKGARPGTSRLATNRPAAWRPS